jgi:NAD(P)-dependent dehydrogenase (short-subunit alcohol dehydrogenase family)
VVTGGGAGIGAAVARELGAAGCFVVTVDPLVSVDGTEQLPSQEETTAERIVSAGGTARASSASVTDGPAIALLFDGLVEEFGHLDAVVNVAGITRPSGFARGTEEDWHSLLSVHLEGYLNVPRAALPIMASAGRGHILGVTSGSGWRAADTGAYGCAKRAVAALTWQLGRLAPRGVIVNAMSPIAATRMVTAALSRAPKAGGSAAGGLSLGSMPTPEEIGPIGAHLVGADFDVCRGRVIFAGGSELALVDEPRFLELVRTDGVTSLDHVLETVVPGAFTAAEVAQASTGGSNPRFRAAFDGPNGGAVLAGPAVSRCAVVGDRPDLSAAIVAALDARGVACLAVGASYTAPGFTDAAFSLDAIDDDGPIDGLVLAFSDTGALGDGSWVDVLGAHAGLASRIYADATWARAVADRAADGDRSLRLVTVTDAATQGGRSRAQASAQLARAARGATIEQVAAFAVSDEGGDSSATAALAAHLLCHPDTDALSGAELAVGDGWIGLRGHPRAGAAISLDAAVVPGWFDAVLAELTR